MKIYAVTFEKSISMGYNHTMKITYLNHSGFLVELDEAYFLFDYHTGQIPLSRLQEILNPEKYLYIFVSHAHGDHYNREIWSLQKTHPNIMFIMSKDVPLSASQKTRLGLTEQDNEKILRVKANESHLIYTEREFVTSKISHSLHLKTLLSTDEGVAFIVIYEEEKHIGDELYFFHAGDLNLWTWPGDEEATNNDRYRRFMLEMEKIRGYIFDVAFFPLDPRQEEACGDGFRIFNEITDTKILFPMHMWGDYSVIEKYKNKYPNTVENMINLQHEGQIFEL